MKLANTISDCFKKAVSASFELFKVMIPIIILVKILKEMDMISWLAVPLEPIMELMGLPGGMGLVWATGLISNIYSAMIVFISLAPDMPLTVAQTTVLCTVLLIAHSLPVEVQVTRQCGASGRVQTAIRVGAALVCGMLMHWLFETFSLMQEMSSVAWTPGDQPATLSGWALNEAQNLLSIFLIVFVLMLIMEALNALRITKLMDIILRPVLTRIGIGPSASAVTIAGLTLGLSYGGGLIIAESRSGRVGKKDMFYSLTLMGLSHALIEDTMLMMMLGADFSGVFWGRLLFSLAFMALLVKFMSRIPDATFEKRFMRAAA